MTYDVYPFWPWGVACVLQFELWPFMFLLWMYKVTRPRRT